MIRVLFFGPVAERMKLREMEIVFQAGMRLQDVVSQLQASHPHAFEIVCFTAVNDTQVRDMQLPLADNDEIAFMAKFSGG